MKIIIDDSVVSELFSDEKPLANINLPRIADHPCPDDIAQSFQKRLEEFIRRNAASPLVQSAVLPIVIATIATERTRPEAIEVRDDTTSYSTAGNTDVDDYALSDLYSKVVITITGNSDGTLPEGVQPHVLLSKDGGEKFDQVPEALMKKFFVTASGKPTVIYKLLLKAGTNPTGRQFLQGPDPDVWNDISQSAFQKQLRSLVAALQECTGYQTETSHNKNGAGIPIMKPKAKADKKAHRYPIYFKVERKLSA